MTSALYIYLRIVMKFVTYAFVRMIHVIFANSVVCGLKKLLLFN